MTTESISGAVWLPSALKSRGTTRLSGPPGVCFAQAAGAANLASGLQDTWLDTAPWLR
jgi:thiamine pyrophosphate-dependent acetolactate synthase large subunit-like protein